MAGFYDSINPVTGRPYSQQFGGSQGSAWAPTGYRDPTSFTPVPRQNTNPQMEQVRGNVRQGADFTSYQNQIDKLLQDQSHNKYQSQIDQLLSNPSSFQNTPGYQAALGAGTQAIERRAAAQGMGNSGNVLAELAKYSGGLASQEYGNQLNRLASLNQQAQQQYGQQLGSLSDMMRNAQQFGEQVGYFQPPQPQAHWSGGAFVTPNPRPSWY